MSPVRPVRTAKFTERVTTSVCRDMSSEIVRSAPNDGFAFPQISENVFMQNQSENQTSPLMPRPSQRESQTSPATPRPGARESQNTPVAPSSSRTRAPCHEPCAESFAVVSRNIYNLWHNEQLCDVKIRAGGRQFLAHKLVMASSCGIFAEEKVEKSTPISTDLVIHDVNADAMNDVLKYFYTHRLHISGHNVDSLLKIAKDLNIQVITDKCKEYLRDVCLKNVVQNRCIAQKFGLSEILAHIDLYFKENFQELSCSTAFLQSDFQQVFDIVSSDVFSPGSALQVFNACASWIDFNRQERLKYAVPLMSVVRFGHIPAEKLVSEVEIEHHIFDIPDCKEMLYQAFKYHALLRDYICPAAESRRQPVQSREMNRVQSITARYPPSQQENSGCQSVAFNFGSSSSEKKASASKVGPSSSGKQASTLSMQSVPSRGISSVHGITGRYSPSQNYYNSSHSAVFKVGPSSSEKQESALSMLTTSKQTLPRPHSAHSVRSSRDELSISRSSSINDDKELSEGSDVNLDMPSPPLPRSIFVVGGVNTFDMESTNSILQMIQQYNPEKNCWIGRTNVPLPLRDCGVASLDGNVYVIGGIVMDISLDVVEITAQCHRFDVAKNEWSQITGLHTPRTDFATVVVNNVIYVVGGVDKQGHTLSSMEYYNDVEDRWHYTSPMNEPRMGLSAAGHRGHVFAAGGMISRPNADKRLLDTVESYNSSTNEWNLKSELPLHVFRSSLVDVNGVLYLVGGCVTRDGDSVLSLSNIFRYSDETDTWEPFTELHVPRHHATAVALDSRLYVIGGTSSATIGRALSNVECIDVETGARIEGIAPLPTPAYGLGGCADTGDFC